MLCLSLIVCIFLRRHFAGIVIYDRNRETFVQRKELCCSEEELIAAVLPTDGIYHSFLSREIAERDVSK